jgi:quinol monooxygenase YgiN
MLIIIGTVRLPPERLRAALAPMEKMAMATRLEDGCIHYAYAEDVLDPGLIRVSEVWRDQAALDRHFQTTHIAEWRAVWPDLAIHDRQLTAYDAANPRPV